MNCNKLINMRKFYLFAKHRLLLCFIGLLFISACDKSEVQDIDTIPPAAITNLKAVSGDKKVTLLWDNPSDNDFDHVKIQYDGNSVSTKDDSIVISGLVNDKKYSFTLFSYDISGNASTGVTISETPEVIVYPSDIIPELSHWKITLPVDKDGNDSSNETDYLNRNTNPLEVYELTNYEYPPYFKVIDNEVVFRAHCAGATTCGSKYPRSELRQLVGGGGNYWSVNDYQYLQVELRVTHTPVEKPNVCITQIHGPENEPLRVHFDANKGLYIVWNHTNHIYIKDEVPYTLGQKLRITVEVNNDNVNCSILNLDNNKSYSYSWTPDEKTGYFKTGCYTQSSIFISQWDSSYNDESPDAYGEVRISKIELIENY